MNCTGCPFKPIASESCGLYHKEAEVCEAKEMFMKAFAEALFKEQFGDLVVVHPIEHMKVELPKKLPHRIMFDRFYPLDLNSVAIIRNKEDEKC